MLAGLEPPGDEAVSDIIGMSLRGAVIALLGEQQSASSELLEKVMDGYRDSYREAEAEIRLFPGVRETLEKLRERGYWLGVVTGKSHSGLLRVLDTFELSDLFLVLRTADCTHSKPHPAMVLECMSELGVIAEQTAVVGDALFDVQMANAAGVRVIGVSFGVASHEQLIDAGAESVVDDFESLLAYFPSLQETV
ncbi:phosphoglycolate phosphatase [Mariprofundus micogutta]|uniref:Phosphoglycolate phosphatase n=1 Tax=Mariprofundus micogutta TaxID=1921010 RepID=A0A1L8CKA8_9PROT|nr:phosphoglycolate phosphatase [Mariprofundus micogutta]